MVENDNQKHIYRSVRKYIFLLLGRGDYTDCDICQSIEVIILLDSICPAIHDNFYVPNTTLQNYLNLIFPLLKCSSLKYLWYLMCLGGINNKSVVNTISEKNVK